MYQLPTDVFETSYLGVFWIAEFETDVKISKLKMADFTSTPKVS